MIRLVILFFSVLLSNCVEAAERRYSNSEIDAKMAALTNQYSRAEIDARFVATDSNLRKSTQDIDKTKSDLVLAVAEANARQQSNWGWQTLIAFAPLGGIIAVVTFFTFRAGNLREGLFKCLDGYWKVMDYKAQADSDQTYEKLHHYYRALFDLQWSEFQIWQRRSLRSSIYREWLNQRHHDFTSDLVRKTIEQNSREICYRLVWRELSENGYFHRSDPFITHLAKVHMGNVEGAMSDRSKWWKFWG